MSRAIADTGTGALARAVATESDRSRRAYLALLEHAGKCVACNQGNNCLAGADLRRARREARR